MHKECNIKIPLIKLHEEFSLVILLFFSFVVVHGPVASFSQIAAAACPSSAGLKAGP